MPIFHRQAGGAHQREERKLKLPRHVIPFRPQHPLGANVVAVLQRLVCKAPERGADCHRRQFAAGVLKGVGLTRNRQHLRQPRVEHAPEVQVAGHAAGGHDHGFLARILIVGFVLSMLPSERKLFNGVVCPGSTRGVYCAVMPSTRPVFCPLRTKLVIL